MSEKVEGKKKFNFLSVFSKMGRFFHDVKSEVKKIVWPTGSATVRNTIIVITMCLIIGVFIWIFDFGFGKLVDWLLSFGA